jgi:hypothetical protein
MRQNCYFKIGPHDYDKKGIIGNIWFDW